MSTCTCPTCGVEVCPNCGTPIITVHWNGKPVVLDAKITQILPSEKRHDITGYTLEGRRFSGAPFRPECKHIAPVEVHQMHVCQGGSS